ncbi:MAG: hypothetical protein U9P80_07800 [Thermodesulfobacteriota bacterium]|nr:hypothetical protein [Thermodesulfobacteriota bacterium]
MKQRVLMYAGSLLSGVIHNINTPLMWIMGRSQLLQVRNDGLTKYADGSQKARIDGHEVSPDDALLKVMEKNTKDLISIEEGADRIDSILKALSYKVQMATEENTAIELKEYLSMETNFLMANMAFKHESKIHKGFEESRSCYVKSDYNALSLAVTGTIDLIIEKTEKGRDIHIGLDDQGMIHLACPQLLLEDEIRENILEACSGITQQGNETEIFMDGSNGFELSIAIKGH